MNSQPSRFFLLSSVFICLLFPATTAFAGSVPPLTIMAEDWAPYNFQKDGVTVGISTDILVLMLEKAGSSQGRKDIEIYPWARAYKMIQKTPNTILFTTARSEEREKMFKWVGPIFVNDFNIYALKSKGIKISSLADIKKYKIGTLRSDVAEELLVKKAGMTVTDFEQVSSNIQNIRKLARGRIDLVVQSRDTTITTCKEAGLDPDDFEAVFTLDRRGMYYAFHKDTPDDVISAFQNAFDDLKKEGKVAEIFKNYGK